MILRVRAPWGSTYRVDLDSNDHTLLSLQEKILPQLEPDNFQIFSKIEWQWSADPEGKYQYPSIPTTTKLSTFGLKNGDLIYFKNATGEKEMKDQNERHSSLVELDTIDRELLKKDGLIKRNRDIQLCRHGDHSMCDYCSPIEPFDENYLKAQKIKHLSFHAYLRKMATDSLHTKTLIGKSKSGFSNALNILNATISKDTAHAALLEEPDYRIKSCFNHAPFPKGLCSKCQPNPITLQPQSYRFVDHVEFDAGSLVDSFLSRWRGTGYQTFGLLYGVYEPYDGVPLGIKAVVHAIHEPLQDGSVDGFELLEENDMYNKLNDIAKSTSKWLGLQPIGMIYTDLLDDGTGTGKIFQTRSASQFFVSCYEILWMAKAQLDHPYNCPWSNTGHFGSRWVTVIASGDKDGHVSLSAYQVSVTATAMVQANLIEASSNPSFMCVNKPSQESSYVPEFFYRKRIQENPQNIDVISQDSKRGNNEMDTSPILPYEKSILCKAEPTFPVDYLLVTLSHGFPSLPDPFFKNSDSSISFLEIFKHINGQGLTNVLLSKMADYLTFHSVYPKCENLKDMLSALSNWQVCMALTALDIFNKEELSFLGKAIREEDFVALDAVVTSPEWSTFYSLLDNALQEKYMNSKGKNDDSSTTTMRSWSCSHCTFINQGNSESCEMCGLPASH